MEMGVSLSVYVWIPPSHLSWAMCTVVHAVLCFFFISLELHLLNFELNIGQCTNIELNYAYTTQRSDMSYAIFLMVW